MPRPKKWRKVCSLPENASFGPLPGCGQAPGNAGEARQCVTMTVDEYEAVRLIDLEGMNQEACAEKMRIARTTVQSIYAEARKKLADSLVNGKLLRIEGGDYELCDGRGTRCGMGVCHRRRGGGGFGL
jgi:predicted DNA-binding protein (UPF0251 family)